MNDTATVTDAMKNAGIRELNATDMVWRDSSRGKDAAHVERIYTAMHAARPSQEATRTVGDAELPDASVMGELAFAARAMRSKKQRELAKLEAKNPIDEHLPSMRKRLARLEEGYLWLNDVRADAPDTAKPDPDAVTLTLRALEAGLEYAIDAANECKVKDFVFDQIMRDVKRIEDAIALLSKATRIGEQS